MLAARAAGGSDRIDLPAARQRWTGALAKVSDQYAELIGSRPTGCSTAAPRTRAGC